MKRTIILLCTLALQACSSEQYDCHIITKYYDWTRVKSCDAPCNKWTLITSSIKERIEDQHEIVSDKELKHFIKSKYDSMDYINTTDQYFTDQTGKQPVQIIKLDCKKL